jgi:hypothetical protein
VGSKSRGFVCWLVAVGGGRRDQSVAVKSPAAAHQLVKRTSVSQAPDRQKPDRHYVIRLAPSFFRAFLVAIHMSHAGKTFLTTFFFFFKVKPCLLFAEITIHVKTMMKEIYNHYCKKPDTQL